MMPTGGGCAINRFRAEVYQSFAQRGDAGLELIDALTRTPGVESPVVTALIPQMKTNDKPVCHTIADVICKVKSKATAPTKPRRRSKGTAFDWQVQSVP